MASARDSSTGDPGSSAGRLGNGLADGEHLVQAGDTEHAQDLRSRAHERDVAPVLLRPLERGHQDAETGRVQELDALEVHDHAVMPVVHELGEPFPQSRRRVRVDVATDRQHVPPVALGRVEEKVDAHAPSWPQSRDGSPRGAGPNLAHLSRTTYVSRSGPPDSIRPRSDDGAQARWTATSPSGSRLDRDTCTS